MCQLRENVTLLTNHTELAWVNALRFGQRERLMWRVDSSGQELLFGGLGAPR